MTISVEQLKSETTKLKELYDDYSVKKKVSTEAYNAVNMQEVKVKLLLESLDLLEFEKVKLVTSARAKVPQDPMEKQAFFDYLIEKGVYDAYRTVNSNSINSFVKIEYELAKERGDFDFKIPGLEIIEETKLKY